MPFAIPGLGELVQRARAAFRSNLPGTDAWLWPNNVGPTAKVIGGMTHEMFGFADYVAKQKFAMTADGENLDRHGYEYGLARRPATPSVGEVVIAAPDGPISVSAGARFSRTDGEEFVASIGGSTPASGTLLLAVTASLDGRTGLTTSGAPLTIETGVIGPGASTATATVAAGGLAGGADVEDDESFRSRILFRKRNPPHGGAPADYVFWASEVPGVTRVFIERRYRGPGTVRVFVLMDDLYPDGIPTEGDVARVQQHIDTLAPAGAIVQVAAPVPLPLSVQVSGLQPFTTAVQRAVEDEVRDAIFRLGRVAGEDVSHPGMPYLASPFSFSRSWIWQAVANATGEERHVLTAPASDVAIPTGSIPVLGTVSFP